MIEEIQGLTFGGEVLHVLPIVDVALQLLYVVLNVLALVGDWEVEGVITEAKLQRVDAITHPRPQTHLSFYLK